VANSQSTNHIMMVEPIGFHSNPQTRETNSYQEKDPDDLLRLRHKSSQEFRAFRDMLVAESICVTTAIGSTDTPDDVFCNNWVSTHRRQRGEGVMVLYPILAPNRQRERREDLIAFLHKLYGRTLDLSEAEKTGQVLEGTGVMCFDRVNKVAYIARSVRMDEEVAARFAQDLDFETVFFDTQNHAGEPIYHTNLMMYIGSAYAGICSAAIVPQDKERVMAKLSQTHEIIDISMDQVKNFCGNALQLTDASGQLVVAMSSRAHAAYTGSQKKTLHKHVDRIIHSDLATIEKYGGGSARCMLLELF